MLGQAKDLPVPVKLDELDWDPDTAVDSLARFRAFVVGRAMDAVEYYQFAKKPKKRWAIWLRMAALVCAGLAGILPILSQIWTSDAGQAVIAPAWASVFLALAAGAVAIDRFFGYSSAWMRFMSSELRVRRAVDDFDLDWEATRAAWAGRAPDDADIQAMIERGKTFLGLIADIVRDETDQWIAEFRETLREIDETARVAAGGEAHGGLRVLVANGDQTDAGWTLSVDGGAFRRYQGRTAALGRVPPGVRTVQARGVLHGRPVQGEAAVAVERGGVVEVEIELT